MKKFFTTLLALLCAGSVFAFDGGYNEGDARVQGSLTVKDPDSDYDVAIEDGYVKLGDGLPERRRIAMRSDMLDRVNKRCLKKA